MTPPKPPNASVYGELVYIRAINWRIDDLKKEIREELKRPAPDFLRLSRLKRQKLHLKDKARGLLKGQAMRSGRHSKNDRSHFTKVRRS